MGNSGIFDGTLGKQANRNMLVEPQERHSCTATVVHRSTYKYTVLSRKNRRQTKANPPSPPPLASRDSRALDHFVIIELDIHDAVLGHRLHDHSLEVYW